MTGPVGDCLNLEKQLWQLNPTVREFADWLGGGGGAGTEIQIQSVWALAIIIRNKGTDWPLNVEQVTDSGCGAKEVLPEIGDVQPGSGKVNRRFQFNNGKYLY